MKTPVIFAVLALVSYSGFSSNTQESIEQTHSGSEYLIGQKKLAKADFKAIKLNSKDIEDISNFFYAYLDLYYKYSYGFYSKLAQPSLSKNLPNELILHICEGSLTKLCKTHQKPIKDLLVRHSDLLIQEEVNSNLIETKYKKDFKEIKHHFNGLQKSAQQAANFKASLKIDPVQLMQGTAYIKSLNKSLSKHADGLALQLASALESPIAHILYTKVISNLIWFPQGELALVDIRNSINEISDNLKSELLTRIMYNHKKELNKLDMKKSEVNALIRHPNAYQWHDLIRSKSVRIPEEFFRYFFFTETNQPVLKNILRKLKLQDPLTVDYIMRGQLQRAIWRLSKLKGHKDQPKAKILKKILHDEILQPKEVQKLSSLSHGVSQTYLITFKGQQKGIFKPTVNPFPHWLVYAAVSVEQEVLAYLFDQELGINMVPLTKEIHLPGFKKGSVQYFVNNTMRARDVSSITTSKYGKFSKPLGRTARIRNMRFFDWLISNWDRNIDNYLISETGKFVMIDHGWTFKAWVFKKPSSSRFAQMIPTKKVYKRLRKIARSKNFMQENYHPYLKNFKLKVFENKVKYAYKKISKLRKEKGSSIFAPAEKEIKLSTKLY